MALLGREQRILNGMEARLRARDPLLTSMFGIFSRLAEHEEMPWRETVLARPRVHLRVIVLVVLLVATTGAAIFGGLSLHARQGCTPLTAASISAHPAHLAKGCQPRHSVTGLRPPAAATEAFPS